MKSQILSQFPYINLVVTGQVIFFLVFVSALVWVFRRNSSEFYDNLARMPLNEESTYE